MDQLSAIARILGTEGYSERRRSRSSVLWSSLLVLTGRIWEVSSIGAGSHPTRQGSESL